MSLLFQSPPEFSIRLSESCLIRFSPAPLWRFQACPSSAIRFALRRECYNPNYGGYIKKNYHSSRPIVIPCDGALQFFRHVIRARRQYAGRLPVFKSWNIALSAWRPPWSRPSPLRLPIIYKRADKFRHNGSHNFFAYYSFRRSHIFIPPAPAQSSSARPVSFSAIYFARQENKTLAFSF